MAQGTDGISIRSVAITNHRAHCQSEREALPIAAERISATANMDGEDVGNLLLPARKNLPDARQRFLLFSELLSLIVDAGAECNHPAEQSSRQAVCWD